MALEWILRTNPMAKAQLDDYRKLDRLLANATPLPPIRWDELARTLSSAIESSSR
jgi:hypothetical protein